MHLKNDQKQTEKLQLLFDKMTTIFLNQFALHFTKHHIFQNAYVQNGKIIFKAKAILL